MSTVNPLVGIVLCSYNPKIDLLSKQIESLKQQTHTNFICWIFDDASEERDIAAIQNIIENDDRFELVRNSTNLKPYRNFEHGISIALNSDVQFISLCDQDDRWTRDKISRQLTRLKGAGIQITSCDLEIVNKDSKVIRKTLRRSKRSSDPIDLLVANDIPGASILMTREFAEKALPFPGGVSNLYHDHWLGLLGASLQVLDIDHTVLYQFVQHRTNSSGDRQDDRWDNLGRSIVQFLRSDVRKDFFSTRHCLYVNLIERSNSNHTLRKMKFRLTLNILKPGISGDRRVGSIFLLLKKRNYLHTGIHN
jgi:glycosyltransferase involved in cell wall biosynthesis